MNGSRENPFADRCRHAQTSKIDLHNLNWHKRLRIASLLSILGRLCHPNINAMKSKFSIFVIESLVDSNCESRLTVVAKEGEEKKKHYFPLNWTRWIFVYTSITWFYYYHTSKGANFLDTALSVDYDGSVSIMRNEKVIQGLSSSALMNAHAWIFPSAKFVVEADTPNASKAHKILISWQRRPCHHLMDTLKPFQVICFVCCFLIHSLRLSILSVPLSIGIRNHMYTLIRIDTSLASSVVTREGEIISQKAFTDNCFPSGEGELVDGRV